MPSKFKIKTAVQTLNIIYSFLKKSLT